MNKKVSVEDAIEFEITIANGIKAKLDTLAERQGLKEKGLYRQDYLPKKIADGDDSIEGIRRGSTDMPWEIENPHLRHRTGIGEEYDTAFEALESYIPIANKLGYSNILICY